LLRYSSENAARAAAAAFHGQDVAEVHGGVVGLSAKIVATESPAVLLPSVMFQIYRLKCRKNSCVIYTSMRVSTKLK